MAEWISVKDKLPEAEGIYVCYAKKDNFSFLDTLRFRLNHKGKKCFCDYDAELDYFEINYVTHWMPLPEPPKGE